MNERRSTAHLHTPEARAKAAATRAERTPRRTTRPGSETTDLTPGDPVRITATKRYKGRSGWVATINRQRFANGLPDYTEIGVTWAIADDWRDARTDVWFRADELERRFL